MNVSALAVEIIQIECAASGGSDEWIVLTQGACGWLLVGQLRMEHGWNLSNGLNFWSGGIHYFDWFADLEKLLLAVLLERFEDFHVGHVAGEGVRCEQTFNGFFQCWTEVGKTESLF